jgi:origin recognition complex subunit 4
MSTRSRKRLLAAADEEEEDELSSPVKGATTTPLSTLKRRKLNTYGKSAEKGKRGSIFGRLGGLFGFAGEDGKGKENEMADELADEVVEDDDETKDNTDLWDVPVSEEEDAQQENMTGKSTGRRSGATKRKDKIAVEEDVNMEDIWEVKSSDAEEVSASIRSKRAAKPMPKLDMKVKDTRKETEENSTPKRGRPKSGAKLNGTSKELEEDNTSKRGRSKSAKKSKDTSNENEAESTPKRGRPKKDPEGKTANSTAPPEKTSVDVAIEPVSPRRSSGRGPRKSDILKKAKALSRQAIREKMMAQAQDEEEETVAEHTRRKSSRQSKVDVEDTHADDEPEIPSARKPGRPRKSLQDVIDSPKAPKGILTPSRKDRTLKTRKIVAFEGKGDLDLGFKDLPKPATQKSKGQTSIEESASDLEEAGLASSIKQSKKSVEILQEEEDDSDEEDEVKCAICSGLKSKKPNEIILCDSCDLAVHQLCYGVPLIPKGDWLCRDCQPDDLLDVDMDDAADIAEVPSNLPEISGFEEHLRNMQRLVLDKLTGQKRVKLRGHDGEMQKVHQVVEQTVLAGEGNSMLVIGARGCGKTTVSLEICVQKTILTLL